MWTPTPLRRAASAAALALLGSAPWAFPAAAQDPGGAQARPAPPFGTDDWTALLVIVALGALGALAYDLAADGGRLDRIRRDDQGWTLGWIGKLVVGVVAALVMLALNPWDGWWQLIGTALTAGIGGEAILLAIAATRAAEREAKKARDADERTRAVAEMAAIRLETVRREALPAAPAPGASPLESVSGGAEVEALPASAGERARTVARLAETFSREIATFAGGSVRQRVRAILVDVLGHQEVDSRPLAEIGGKDPGVRRLIARDIRLQWSALNPPWTDGDVTEASTLRSLSDEVDRRGGA